MRIVRLSAALLAAAAAVVLGAGVASASTADVASGPTHYVALGDSYSSGVGAGNYIQNSCSRSGNAYSQQWSASNHPASFSFAACSGATVPTVKSNQLGSLSATTDLVSITVGGNDVGFANVMQTCTLSSEASCITAVNSMEAKAQKTLPASLDALYTQISSASPLAKVVVLDYPHLFSTTSASCFGPDAKSRAKLNEGADVLDTAIATVAAKHGFSFADVRPSFTGHEICSASPWLNGVDFATLSSSYHPTQTGQINGYLPAFAAAA